MRLDAVVALDRIKAGGPGSGRRPGFGTGQTYKEHKGVYYFPTHQDAHNYAVQNGHPTNRIIQYGRGHAIQLRESGPYVGSTKEKIATPEDRKYFVPGHGPGTLSGPYPDPATEATRK